MSSHHRKSGRLVKGGTSFRSLCVDGDSNIIMTGDLGVCTWSRYTAVSSSRPDPQSSRSIPRVVPTGTRDTGSRWINTKDSESKG